MVKQSAAGVCSGGVEGRPGGCANEASVPVSHVVERNVQLHDDAAPRQLQFTAVGVTGRLDAERGPLRTQLSPGDQSTVNAVLSDVRGCLFSETKQGWFEDTKFSNRPGHTLPANVLALYDSTTNRLDEVHNESVCFLRHADRINGPGLSECFVPRR